MEEIFLTAVYCSDTGVPKGPLLRQKSLNSVRASIEIYKPRRDYMLTFHANGRRYSPILRVIGDNKMRETGWFLSTAGVDS